MAILYSKNELHNAISMHTSFLVNNVYTYKILLTR